MVRPDRFKLYIVLNQGSGLSNEQQLLKVGHVPGWRALRMWRAPEYWDCIERWSGLLLQWEKRDRAARSSAFTIDKLQAVGCGWTRLRVFLFVDDGFWDWGRGTGLEAGGAGTGVQEWR
jgi:hypothetical protein